MPEALSTNGTRTVHRYRVPVDDRPHTIELTSWPRHVASRTHGEVEFWAESDPRVTPEPIAFIVIGTGHTVPPGARYVGTALAEFGLVWHLYEVR